MAIGACSLIRLRSPEQLPYLALAPSAHMLMQFLQSKLFVEIELSFILKRSIPRQPSSIGLQSSTSSTKFAKRSQQNARSKLGGHLDCHQSLRLIAG